MYYHHPSGTMNLVREPIAIFSCKYYTANRLGLLEIAPRLANADVLELFERVIKI